MGLQRYWRLDIWTVQRQTLKALYVCPHYEKEKIKGEKAMLVEVFGPEPPCWRCMKTLEVVNQAVKELQLDCEVAKIDAYSRPTIAKYGLVFTPAIAIDGKVCIAGRIPSLDEVKKLLHITQRLKECEHNAGK